MSIFSTIRFPISFPPKKEELEALPQELYMKWISESEWGKFIPKYPPVYKPENVSEWYRKYFDDISTFRSQDMVDLQHLRKLVFEWDENEPI